MSSNLDMLIKYAQSQLLGADDQEHRAISELFGNEPEDNIEYDRDICPCHIGKVRQSIESLGINIFEDDIGTLVKMSQNDPVMFRIMYDTLLMAKKSLDENMPEGWAEQYYLSTLTSSTMETNSEIEDFMYSTWLGAPKNEEARREFNEFWHMNYDSFVITTAQFKRKVVYTDSQPLVYFSVCNSMRKKTLTQKAFLSVARAGVA